MKRTLRVGLQSLAFEGRSTTRVYGILGGALAHSLSPRMQQAAFAAVERDAVYLRFAASAPDLAAVMADLRALADRQQVCGWNITLPHKQQSVTFLDRLDDAARLAGAVNTVLVQQQAGRAQLVGCNTDIHGLRAAAAEHGVRLAGRTLLVVGAGGAARAAVAWALQDGAREVRVVNRSVANAGEMLDAFAVRWPGALPRFVCRALTADANTLVDGADVLVQATSVGLAADEALPFGLEAAAPHLFVLETQYRRETALLRVARERGLPGTDGFGMLLHQGAEAFRLWTGLEPPLAVMRQALTSVLAAEE